MSWMFKQQLETLSWSSYKLNHLVISFRGMRHNIQIYSHGNVIDLQCNTAYNRESQSQSWCYVWNKHWYMRDSAISTPSIPPAFLSSLLPPLFLAFCLSREEVTCCRPALCHLADFLSSLPQESEALQGMWLENTPHAPDPCTPEQKLWITHAERTRERDKRQTKNTAGKPRGQRI